MSTAPTPARSTDDAELLRLYVDTRLSPNQIADLTGISQSTIRRRLKHLGVDLRDQRAAQALRYSGRGDLGGLACHFAVSPDIMAEALRRYYFID